MSWVYRWTAQHGCYAVGFIDNAGFCPVEGFTYSTNAARRCNFLNGGDTGTQNNYTGGDATCDFPDLSKNSLREAMGNIPK